MYIGNYSVAALQALQLSALAYLSLYYQRDIKIKECNATATVAQR
jgi:hypothetical protein